MMYNQLMMKLSVIIPFYYGKPGKSEKLENCIASLGDEPDEILVIGNVSAGLPWSLNKGLKAASGNFLLIMSDDMVLIQGKLADLCSYNYVTHPLVDGYPQVFGGCVCYPRHIFEKVGLYDENFIQGYYDDDDYFRRVAKAGYERAVVSGVNVLHDDPGHTLRSLVNNDMMEHNRRYLQNKWGESCQTPLPSIMM